MEDALLTTPQVAERLGIGIRRVQALIHAGRLPSQQYGRDHLIKESDLALVAERKRGRPPKPADTDTDQASAPAEKANPTRKAGSKNGSKNGSKKGSNQ